MERRSRPFALGLLMLITTVLLGACGSTNGTDPSPKAFSGTSLATAVPAARASSPPSSAPTTALPSVPASQIQDCIDYVMFGAWVQNPLLSEIWNSVGQSESALRAKCRWYGEHEPASLAALVDGWERQQRELERLEREALPSTTARPAPRPTTPPAPVYSPAPACGSDSYINVDGNCVSSPVYAPSAPAGASAQCRDGTYSFSQNRRGTCSHHGGVAVWL